MPSVEGEGAISLWGRCHQSKGKVPSVEGEGAISLWGRCQPYRDSEAPVVSGPLIGQHSPAVLIPYAQGPGRGSGCIRKCCFASTNLWVYSQM